MAETTRAAASRRGLQPTGIVGLFRTASGAVRAFSVRMTESGPAVFDETVGMVDITRRVAKVAADRSALVVFTRRYATARLVAGHGIADVTIAETLAEASPLNGQSFIAWLSDSRWDDVRSTADALLVRLATIQ